MASVTALNARRPRRISRPAAFQAQGVSLKYPSRSWSGVRVDDGAVVIAISNADVQVHLDGFTCLLWSPGRRSHAGWIDSPSRERLDHCRLAAAHGGADGLVVHQNTGEVDANVVLALRVENRRGEYWAVWGSAGRSAALEPNHEQRQAVSCP